MSGSFDLKPRLRRWRSSAWRQRTAILAALFTIAVSAVYAIDLHRFLTVTEPALTVVSANAEAVQVVEASADRGAVLLSPALLMRTDGGDWECARGILKPMPGTTLLVVRQLDDDIVLTLTSPNGAPAAEFSTTAAEENLGDTVRVKFISAAATARLPSPARDGRDCIDSRRVIRLPVYGPMTIGAEFGAQLNADDSPLLVRTGHIDTFAAASKTLLDRIVPANGSGAAGRELFPTGSTTLPSGVRIRECAPPRNLVPWSGYIEARLGVGDDQRALDVQAFTDARRIAVMAPGGSRTGGVDCNGEGDSPANREDVIGVSLLSRLVADPNIAAEAVLFAFIVLILQVLLSIVDVARSAEEDGEPPE